MSYGLSPYGLSPYGSAPGPISMVSAVAISTRTVEVTLTAEPAHSSPTVTGDALNPATWRVARADTGQVFTVAAITEVSPLVFDVEVLEVFGGFSVVHTISSTTLIKANGDVIVAPNSESFAGVLGAASSTHTAQAVARRFIVSDVANPQPTGTLLMTAGGDYASESGASLTQKLILRRLSTLPGGFFHLPNYGIGLGEKELLPNNDVVRLRAQIERQILQEPDVLAVSAPVSFTPQSGILLVQISATLRTTGQAIKFRYQPTVVQL